MSALLNIRDIIHKLEVHNVAQCPRGRPSHGHGVCTPNFGKVGPAVPKYTLRQTETQTHRRTDGLITILNTRYVALLCDLYTEKSLR